MANKNYSKMSKKKNNKPVEENNEALNEQVDVNEVVNDTVDNEPVLNEEVNNAATEEVNEPVNDELKVGLEGVVTGCKKLYVRSKAKRNAEPLCIIDEGTNVIVYNTESTKDFYKVRLSSGVEGYCMKKFIIVK